MLIAYCPFTLIALDLLSTCSLTLAQVRTLKGIHFSITQGLWEAASVL